MPEHLEFIELRAAIADHGGFALTSGVGGAGDRFARWVVERLDGPVTYRHEYWLPGAIGASTIFSSAGSKGEFPRFNVAGGLVGRYIGEEFGLDPKAAAVLTEHVGHATCLLDLPIVSEGAFAEEGALDVHTLGALRGSSRFAADYRTLAEHGGNRLLDLIRAIHLVAPAGMHLGDEWADIASAVSGRQWSLSDASFVLAQFPALFELSGDEEDAVVRPCDAYCDALFGGLVPVSASEYHKLFRWMLARSVDSLTRSDEGDSFIRQSLPRIAAKAGMLDAVVSDGCAMLAADRSSLVSYLESSPELMVLPGAKAVLLHAHRLGDRASQPAAQMEFALRRLGLSFEADQLADVIPVRSWRPAWSSSRPVNVNRVLYEASSSVISLAVSGTGSAFRAYAGFGDGRVVQVRLSGEHLSISDADENSSEVRSVAAVETERADLVVTASSDSGVRAYSVNLSGEGESPTLLWAGSDGNDDPLSAVAISVNGVNPPVVLSAGVKGRLWKRDLATGENLGLLLDWGAEIRSIRAVQVDGQRVAVILAVDGRIGFVEVDTGAELAVENVELSDPEFGSVLTPISLDALSTNERVEFLVGCATGHLMRGFWSPAGGVELRELCAEHVRLATANSVKLKEVDGSLNAYVARSDGVWLRHRSSDENDVIVRVGHAGPVLSLCVVSVPTGESMVLTGGSEGSVRVWRHTEQVSEKLGHLRVNRHRGAVTAIAVEPRDRGEVEIATGGADHDVRLWRPSDPSTSRVLRDQGGGIASLLWVESESGRRLIVGAADGSVRIHDTDQRETDAGTQLSSTLIGIAHEGVSVLAPSEPGKFLSGGADGGVTIWDGDAGVPRASFQVFEFGAVNDLLQVGGTVLAGGQDGTIRAVDARTHRVARSSWRISSVVSIAPIEQTGRIAVGFANGEIRCGPASSILEVQPDLLFKHAAGVEALCCLQVDGEPVIAIAGRDRRVVLVDASTGAERYAVELEGFPNALTGSRNLLGVATTGGATLFEFFSGRRRQVGTPEA